MSAAATIRVPHLRDGSIVAKVGLALCAIVVASLSFGPSYLHAQNVCGLQAIKESQPLIYPPIAKAAGVEGSVVLLVQFSLDGTVSNARVVYGPKLLEIASLNFVRSLRANSFAGPRECPVVLRFQMLGDEHECSANEKTINLPPAHFVDVQHYQIYGARGCFVTMASTTSAQ
jgi:hypothetical protein